MKAIIMALAFVVVSFSVTPSTSQAMTKYGWEVVYDYATDYNGQGNASLGTAVGNLNGGNFDDAIINGSIAVSAFTIAANSYSSIGLNSLAASARNSANVANQVIDAARSRGGK